jgi:hypothetical protein
MKNQKAVEILRKTRLIIIDPAVWVNHAPSINKSEHCVFTAFVETSLNYDINQANIALFALADEMDGLDSISKYNDTHTHKEVIDVIGRAISRLEKE